MKRYNIDFFDIYSSDGKLINVHHDVVDDIQLFDDYLSLTTNTIYINRTYNIKKNNLIYIKGPFEYTGIVTDVSTTNFETQVTFGPFIMLFEQEILFDTNLQNSSNTSLENFMRSVINNYWISNSDSYQNIPVLNVSTNGSTSKWSFNIKPDRDENHYTIISFYSSIIAKAMSKYGVGIYAKPNFYTMKLDVTIGSPETTEKVHIGANQRNIVVDTFSVNDSTTTVNKLIIYNTDNYGEYITYYMHPGDDHIYNTSNSNRITPVVLELETASPVESDSPENRVTFAQAAQEVADSIFSGVEWTNLIELEVSINDALIRPLELEYGQQVLIYYDSDRNGGKKQFASLLTGKNIDSTSVVLVFGTVRVDLTKILKMGGN